MPPLPNRLFKRWSELREEFAARGNFLLGIREGEEWYAFVGEEDTRQLNKKLLRLLEAGTSGAGRKVKPTMPADWRGFMLPEKEVDRLGSVALRGAVAMLTALKNDFQWYNYIVGLKEASSRKASVSLVEAGLWLFVLHYADMLNVAHREGRDITPLMRRLPGGLGFNGLLPSEQCLELLLLLCRRAYASHWNGNEFERLLSAAHGEVRSFIGPNRMMLERALANGRSSGAVALAEGFYACCRADLQYVVIQELLDDSHGEQLHLSLPLSLRERFGPSHKDSLAGRFKSLTGNLGLRGVLRRSTPTAPAAAPRYTTPFTPMVNEKSEKWSSLTEDDRTLLVCRSGNGGTGSCAAAHRQNKNPGCSYPFRGKHALPALARSRRPQAENAAQTPQRPAKPGRLPPPANAGIRNR